MTHSARARPTTLTLLVDRTATNLARATSWSRPNRSCVKEVATMNEKRVAKTRAVTGRSGRDARGQVV
jgi:hypothetical protein